MAGVWQPPKTFGQHFMANSNVHDVLHIQDTVVHVIAVVVLLLLFLLLLTMIMLAHPNGVNLASCKV
jgi:hypothetical protein